MPWLPAPRPSSSYLFPDQASKLSDLAYQAALSRVMAGVASPSDALFGLDLGQSVGQAIVAYAQPDGSNQQFNGSYPPMPASGRARTRSRRSPAPGKPKTRFRTGRGACRRKTHNRHPIYGTRGQGLPTRNAGSAPWRGVYFCTRPVRTSAVYRLPSVSVAKPCTPHMQPWHVP